MSVDRRHPAALARLFDSAAAPIVVVDPSGKIPYANAALIAWAGVAAGELQAQRCVFGDDPAAAPAARVAAALCPDPTLFAPGGEAFAASTTSHPLHPDAPPTTIRWWRLTDVDGDVRGVVGMLETTAALDDDAIEADPLTQAHDALRARRAALGTARFDLLVGESAGIRLAAARVSLFAGLAAPVWIRAPRGAGERALARALHAQSSARDRACIEIDAATTTDDVLIARLRALGTSAESRRGGTLIVYDADHLSPTALRRWEQFLSKHPAWRAIATSERSPHEVLLDVSLEGAVERRTLDAFAAALIELPPLAGRLEDLPLLVQAIIERDNLAADRQLRGATHDALERLAAHRWPGDVAELEAALAATRSVATGPEILPDDLPSKLRHAEHARAHPRAAPQTIDLTALLEQVERAALERALTAARGNKTTAAKSVGLTRPRFYRRLVELGLLPADDADDETTPAKPRGRRRQPSTTHEPTPSTADAAHASAAEEIEFIADLPFLPADDEDEDERFDAEDDR